MQRSRREGEAQEKATLTSWKDTKFAPPTAITVTKDRKDEKKMHLKRERSKRHMTRQNNRRNKMRRSSKSMNSRKKEKKLQNQPKG